MNTKSVLLSLIIAATLTPAYTIAGDSDSILTHKELAELEQNNQLYIDEQQERKAYLSKLKKTAEEHGYQHGYATQMRYIEEKMMANKAFWNGLFDFSSLTSLLSQGAAKGMYLIGGIVDEVDGSITTVNEDLLLAEGKKYIIRRYPSLRISPPHWVDYLFNSERKSIEPPRKDVLPKNDEERDIWRRAVAVGWDDGSQVAYDEFRQRYTVLFADLTGMVRYWRLVESGIVKDVKVKATNYKMVHTTSEEGEELTFNPTSIQITEQSTFSAKPENWSATSYQGAQQSASDTVRDAIILGQVDLEEVMNSDITVLTPEHEATINQIKNEQFKQY